MRDLKKIFTLVLVMLFIIGCDTDNDNLPDDLERALGTEIDNPDTDGDGVWDGEEVRMFLTDPKLADSDYDELDDRIDPEPLRIHCDDPEPMPIGEAEDLSGCYRPYPKKTYAIFKKDLSTGSDQEIISETRYSQNHVFYWNSQEHIVYQTYLKDKDLGGFSDGEYTEADLGHSAIAVMRADGSRPRLLTDIDSDFRKTNNGEIDITPSPCPDCAWVLFVSSREIQGISRQEGSLRLFMVDILGSEVHALHYEDNAPAFNESDGDPHWGPNNTVTFKREKVAGQGELTASRIYTANIDPLTKRLSNVQERTSPEETPKQDLAVGDFDPKLSPDTAHIASYRKICENGVHGAFDLWIGETFALLNENLLFLFEDANECVSPYLGHQVSAELMPTWNSTGEDLAFWQLTSEYQEYLNDDNELEEGYLPISTDIVVLDLITQSATNTTNAYEGNRWSETMPSWHPSQSNILIFSGSRDCSGDGGVIGGCD